jgi:hypothetical protein
MTLLPQIILITLCLISLGLEIAKHGEMKEPNRHNIWTWLTAAAITHGLLWWGGFYDPMISAIGGAR